MALIWYQQRGKTDNHTTNNTAENVNENDNYTNDEEEMNFLQYCQLQYNENILKLSKCKYIKHQRYYIVKIMIILTMAVIWPVRVYVYQWNIISQQCIAVSL